MTHTTFRQTLRTLGWTTGGLARFLGCSPDRVRNWIRSDARHRIPDDVAEWLERRVALHEAAMRDDPPPSS
jgi:hypothetical protein